MIVVKIKSFNGFEIHSFSFMVKFWLKYLPLRNMESINNIIIQVLIACQLLLVIWTDRVTITKKKKTIQHFTKKLNATTK